MRSGSHNPEAGAAFRRSAWGMTYTDMTAALAVIVLLLGGLVGVSRGLVHDSALRQTRQTLTVLGRALHRYHAAHGVWPSATRPRYVGSAMARCVAAFRASPRTAPLIAGMPGLHATRGGWLTARDGYGRVMRYVRPRGGRRGGAEAGRFPPSPAGRPFIVSAGPDGAFGDLSSNDPDERAGVLDNLYSHELQRR